MIKVYTVCSSLSVLVMVIMATLLIVSFIASLNKICEIQGKGTPSVDSDEKQMQQDEVLSYVTY